MRDIRRRTSNSWSRRERRREEARGVNILAEVLNFIAR
jgi:hypothetical protein